MWNQNTWHTTLNISTIMKMKGRKAIYTKWSLYPHSMGDCDTKLNALLHQWHTRNYKKIIYVRLLVYSYNVSITNWDVYARVDKSSRAFDREGEEFRGIMRLDPIKSSYTYQKMKEKRMKYRS